MKRYLFASFILAASSAALAAPSTVTVNINHIKISPTVSFVSIKYIYASPCPGQYCFNGGSNEVHGISSSDTALLLRIVNPIMKNIFYPVPAWVAASETPPYYVWFGIYDAASRQSTFPASCEILLNTSQNIDTVTIDSAGCTVS